MSLIEGVGDEVTVGVSLFMLLCLVLLAWFSTHTRDIPFVSIIVVELSQRRNRNRNNRESAAGGEEGASTQRVENDDGENGTVNNSADGGTGASANNNAETYNDGGEESASAAGSKRMTQAVTSHSNAPYLESKAYSSSSKPPGAASSDAREQTVQSGITESRLESPSQTDTLQVSSQAPVSSDITSLEFAEVAATNISDFAAEDQSSDEVRRRRVAYFESTTVKECQSVEKKSGMVSADAEWEKSSLGAQSQCERSDSLPLPRAVSSCHEPGEEFQLSGLSLADGSSPPCEWSQLVISGSPPPLPPTLGSDQGPGEDTGPSGPSVAVGSSPPCEWSQSVTSGNSLPSAARDSSSPAGRSASASSLVIRREDSSPGSPTGVGGYLSNVRGSVENEQNAASADSSTENVDENGQQIRVRLKYLNDTQRLVYADPEETVGNFRRLHFSSELEDNKIVRFIFNGQDLRNDLSTLRAYNIADNSIIHCLITQNRQNEPDANARRGTEDDESQMGEFIYPVFGLILGLVWYLRFTYKQYFNAMSTVSLAGVSFIYVLALFSSLRHRRQPHQHLD